MTTPGTSQADQRSDMSDQMNEGPSFKDVDGSLNQSTILIVDDNPQNVDGLNCDETSKQTP